MKLVNLDGILSQQKQLNRHIGSGWEIFKRDCVLDDKIEPAFIFLSVNSIKAM